MTQEELREIIAIDENFRIELTIIYGNKCTVPSVH